MLPAIFLLFLSINWSTGATDETLVKTTLGSVIGWEKLSRDKRPYFGWTKIPYAQPPVGKLRFKAPVSPKPWKDTLNASEDIPACMQPGIPGLPVNRESMSEDCLYLNIYRPKGVSKKKMSVLVYIHGGAFMGGNVRGSAAADYLMDEDIVLVEVSYRVNGFGFMTLNTPLMSGNYGQKDQVRALQWIRNNIEAFGGNKNNIVVFGESSGSASAHLLLKSPLSRDLVSKAVSHSGVINHVSTMLSAEFVTENTLKVAKILKCAVDTTENTFECLQNTPATDLLNAIESVTQDPVQLFFVPVIEPASTKSAFATEDLSLVPSTKPWMNTFANGEYTLYTSMFSNSEAYVKNAYNDVTKYLEDWVQLHQKDPERYRLGAAILKEFYFPKPLSLEEFTVQLAKFHGDNNFVYTALYNAQLHKGPKWLCQLEYKTNSLPGLSQKDDVAGHASHTEFYFNSSSNPESNSVEFITASKRLIKYLINFVENSDPTPKGSPLVWNEHKTNEILRITKDGDEMGSPQFFLKFERLRRLWEIVIGWQ